MKATCSLPDGRLPLFALSFATLVPLFTIAFSQPRLSHAQAPSAVSANATTSASASASASSKPLLPRFRDDLPPDEKSEMPKPLEWKTATAFRPDNSKLVGNCSFGRIREWVRVTCTGAGAQASVIAGNGEGWSASVPIASPGSGVHWMQFPIRRGDRRLMELRELVSGNYGDGLYVGGGSIYSVQWNEGEAPSFRLR